MTATLHHAQPVLSAASSSGFRESGLQSLNCLHSTSDSSSPIVAVRASGLALESIIGYCEEDNDRSSSPDTEPIIRSLVSEEYLQMLIAISNERFVVNAERKDRFRACLLDLCSGQGKGKKAGWEDAEMRRERKRAEGLKRREEMKAREETRRDDEGDISDSDELGGFF